MSKRRSVHNSGRGYDPELKMSRNAIADYKLGAFMLKDLDEQDLKEFKDFLIMGDFDVDTSRLTNQALQSFVYASGFTSWHHVGEDYELKEFYSFSTALTGRRYNVRPLEQIDFYEIDPLRIKLLNQIIKIEDRIAKRAMYEAAISGGNAIYEQSYLKQQLEREEKYKPLKSLISEAQETFNKMQKRTCRRELDKAEKFYLDVYEPTR